ncbi:MAG: glycosyltransferase [Bacteroidetes bacterium]|nr:glycosyltransferase [Bacteroidota bacterium]
MAKTEPKKIKILFFIDSLRSGGKERRLTELLKVLALEKNIESELAVMSNEIHYKEIIELGIKIHYLVRNPKWDPGIFFSFHKICKEFKPDIVHCWDSMTAIYAIPACRLLKIRFVNGMIIVAPHKLSFFSKQKQRALITFPFSDVIVSNSHAGLATYGAPADKSVCIHNGFNFDRINSINHKDIILKELNTGSKLLVGMVASFSVKKDYKTYFAAARLILSKRKDVVFLAIGSSTDSQDAKAHIPDDLSSNFRLLGKRDNVESYVNVMDICVLSTFTEGISNSILEYMALGKPVIATSGGGTVEIVQDKVTGFLVPESDPEALASGIEQLMNDPKLRENMGTAGKTRVEEEFSIHKMAERFLTIYKAE